MDNDSLRPGVTTVTPTRRLAHWLKDRHDEACLRQGLEVWRTPDVLTWSGLVERLYTEGRQAGRLAGRWLTEGAARLVWERIVLRDPETASLVSPGRLGRTAHESWRRMHAHEIPAHALGSEGRPESVAFARWALEFTDWMRANDWVDESLATALLGTAPAGTRIELTGFDALAPAQASLLARLEKSGVAVTHRAPAARRGIVTRVECQDRMGEFDAAARWAAARLDRDPQARLAIVVPDLRTWRDEARRSIERVLVPAATLARGPAPESLGFELAAARALSAQPVVAAALEIIDAFSRGADLAAAGRLLRNPFVAGPGEADMRARLDSRIRRNEGPDLGLARLASLAGAGNCPGFARALRAGLALVEHWPRKALPSRWSQLWFRLLDATGWPGAGLDGNEYQSRQRWDELLAETGAIDDCTGVISTAEAAALLRDQADGVLFEPQELRTGLTVIDPQTCAGMSFDALWVCGLDTARWPSPASPDPFLPREWQTKQNLPGATAEIAVAEARRVLARLCGSAEDVVLSVPRFEGEAPLLPSALIADVPCGDPPDRWTAPIPAAAIFAARPELERLTDGSMPAVATDETSGGGARLLEIQSACPFRAQAEFRLGARPLEDSELGVAASDRGELVHAVMARLWREIGTQQALRGLTPDDLRTAIQGAIDVESAPARQSAAGFMRHLLDIEADWLHARVQELLAKDLERPPFSIESVEQGHAIDIGGLSPGPASRSCRPAGGWQPRRHRLQDGRRCGSRLMVWRATAASPVASLRGSRRGRAGIRRRVRACSHWRHRLSRNCARFDDLPGTGESRGPRLAGRACVVGRTAARVAPPTDCARNRTCGGRCAPRAGPGACLSLLRTRYSVPHR